MGIITAKSSEFQLNCNYGGVLRDNRSNSIHYNLQAALSHQFYYNQLFYLS
jgi:hypothetical protein